MAIRSDPDPMGARRGHPGSVGTDEVAELPRTELAWLTAEEARRYLRVGESELYRWLNGGAYPVGVVVRIGKVWRISRAWLEGRVPIAGVAGDRTEPTPRSTARTIAALYDGAKRVRDREPDEGAAPRARQRGQAW